MRLFVWTIKQVEVGVEGQGTSKEESAVQALLRYSLNRCYLKIGVEESQTKRHYVKFLNASSLVPNHDDKHPPSDKGIMRTFAFSSFSYSFYMFWHTKNSRVESLGL